MKKIIILIAVLCLFALTSSAQEYHWQTIGSGIYDGGPDNATVLNSKMYIGGTFKNVDGQTANNFAVVEGDHFSEAGSIPGSKTYCYGYSVATQTVYAFSADSPNYMFAQSETGEWNPMNISFNAQPRFMTAINDSEFVISGEFTVINGNSYDYVCVWNAESGNFSNIGSLPGPANITGMSFYMDKLLIPYYLPTANDPHFMVLDLATRGLGVDSAMILPNQLLFCFLSDSNLLFMSYLGIDGFNHIAKYDDQTWVVIGLSGSGVVGMTIDADGALIITGTESIDSIALANGIARYDGSWHSFPGNLGGGATKVINYDGTLCILGNMWFGGTHSVGIARWVLETGIHEIPSSIPILIFPNPATDQVLLSGVKNGETIFITDLMGKVLKKAIVSDSYTLDLNNFAPGVYMVSTDEAMEKLIVIHYPIVELKRKSRVFRGKIINVPMMSNDAIDNLPEDAV